MKKVSPSLSTDKHMDLLLPLTNAPSYSNEQIEDNFYREQDRIIGNRLKGNKIYMSQYRQKQQLKTQSIHNHTVVRSYLHNVIDQDYMHLDQTVMQSHNYINGNIQEIGDFAARSNRPRTGGVLTADPAYRNRKKRMQLNSEAYRNRTMVVTSSGIRAKSNPLRPSNYFISHNLDNKMNDFMNLVIRNEGKKAPTQQNYMTQIHNEGIIPHSRKLNNYERRMKIQRKQKSKSKSNDKIKINLETDLINFKTISKTLETISSHNQSPLVTNLEHKTIFGRLSTKNNLKKVPFYHHQ